VNTHLAFDSCRINGGEAEVDSDSLRDGMITEGRIHEVKLPLLKFGEKWYWLR
jgi:hypothetical protein